MVDKDLKAVVIGGGVHGLSSAIALAREGVRVSLLEKHLGLMEGTSRATQNRAHLGYHYPRSPETAVECLKGLDFFKKKYPGSLFYIGEDYYLIERNESLTSFEQFKTFCDQVGLPYEIKMPPRHLWNEEFIEGGFKVEEPVYNPEVLKRLLESEASELGVEIRTGSEVVGMEDSEGRYKIISLQEEETDTYDANLVINATYAYANNVMKILGLEEDMVRYVLQNTEVAIARSKAEVPALTIMDGPFVTLLPFTDGGDGRLFLVYDVLNSVLDQKEGYFLDDSKRRNSNWVKIMEHGEKYFPFFQNLEYIASLYGSRPVPAEVIGDSRQTRITAHQKFPGIFSILEGKFISAPLIAERLVEQIKENGFIK
jgi:glycerol-3-phosphate dehydrogenase